VKGWIVYGTNLLQALPQRQQVIEAIQHLDLLVAIDVLPAEIVGYADVVLPEATYLERFDDVGPTPWREPFVAIRQPVVPPMYESKPGWWIAKELAKRMDLGAYFPYEDAGTMVASRLEKGATTSRPSAGRESSAEEGPRDDGGRPRAELRDPLGEDRALLEADGGGGPAAAAALHAPPVAGDGQFRLLFGRTPVHTFGRTTNNRFPLRVYAENEVWMNAKAATEQGLSNEDRVVLVNQDGVRSQPARLKATQRIRPDCVFVVHGYGHESDGLKFAKGEAWTTRAS